MKRKTIEGHIPGQNRRSLHIEPWMELRAAIVQRAVDDYIDIIRKMWKPRLSIEKKRLLLKEKMELERFFHSRWYDCLCDISPERLIAGCIRRAEEMEKEVIERKNKQIVKNWLKRTGRIQQNTYSQGGNQNGKRIRESWKCSQGVS